MRFCAAARQMLKSLCLAVLFILAGAFVGLDKVVQNRVAKGSIGFGAQLQPKSTPAADAPAPSLDSLGISTNDASKPQTFLPFFSSSSPTAAAPDLLDLVSLPPSRPHIVS